MNPCTFADGDRRGRACMQARLAVRRMGRRRTARRSKRRFTPEAAYSAIGRFRIRVGACEAPATSLARVAGLRRAKLRPAARFTFSPAAERRGMRTKRAALRPGAAAGCRWLRHRNRRKKCAAKGGFAPNASDTSCSSTPRNRRAGPCSQDPARRPLFSRRRHPFVNRSPSPSASMRIGCSRSTSPARIRFDRSFTTWR